MKLSEYAKQQGISYRTALRWWKAGQIPGFQAATGTIIVQEPPASGSAPQRVAVYARVFSHEHQATLDRQAERLVAHCGAKGDQGSPVVQEIVSGVHDAPPTGRALALGQAGPAAVIGPTATLPTFALAA